MNTSYKNNDFKADNLYLKSQALKNLDPNV